jgi:serine/threonine-protein kinase
MTEPDERLRAALSGRYRIEREIGSGGMATVYLAEDLKHHREVALKVMRPELSAILGGERFLREVSIAAKLNHPHILALHDSGQAEEFLYYVMPYVKGESLRAKLKREHQLPVDEAISITRQVGAALDYAHQQGVIHRDIKPENILLHEGEALVADFGIALALSAAGGTRLTDTGLSLGTPEYMSPEQATGERDLDARSEVYSLGAMTYEMLVGEPPHTGHTVQAIIAKVVSVVPQPVSSVRHSVPGNVDAAVQCALSKVPADRFGSGAEFAEALTNPGFALPTAAGVVGPGAAARSTPLWRVVLPWALLAATTAGLMMQLVDRRPNESRETVRFAVRLPAAVEGRVGPGLALADDGSRLVLPTSSGLVVRDMAQSDVRFLSGPGGEIEGGQPSFSPDGRWVAFSAGGQLRRVSLEGGTPVPIADSLVLFYGGSWGPGNTVVYVPNVFSGLWTVAVEGGTPAQVTVPDSAGGEWGHWYPQILPGGKKVLFNVYRTPFDSSGVEVVDLETRQRTVLFKGGHDGRYVPTGHIVYMRGETLWAIGFDLDRLEVEGPGEPVLESVSYTDLRGDGDFTISENGTLVYMEASVANVENRLVWVDRDGTERPITEEWGLYGSPGVSPDGGRVVYDRRQRGESDIWVHDPALGGIPRRVTRNAGWPVWTRDGTGIIYLEENPQLDLYRRDWRAGAVPAEQLLTSPFDKIPFSVSPDGRELAYEEWGAGGVDIWILQLEGEPRPRPFRATEYAEGQPAFSPDGRWIAYVSRESGRQQIWLESYPDAARGRRQISREGGASPRWGVGGELFFRRGSIMAVQIDLASGSAGTPTALEGVDLGQDWDVAPDGQRFVTVKPRPGMEPGREVMVVLNWFEELKEKVGR